MSRRTQLAGQAAREDRRLQRHRDRQDATTLLCQKYSVHVVGLLPAGNTAQNMATESSSQVTGCHVQSRRIASRNRRITAIVMKVKSTWVGGSDLVLGRYKPARSLGVQQNTDLHRWRLGVHPEWSPTAFRVQTPASPPFVDPRDRVEHRSARCALRTHARRRSLEAPGSMRARNQVTRGPSHTTMGAGQYNYAPAGI